MVKFFEENKRVREACHYMEESFREAAAAMWEQANKIDKLKMENAKLKRENEQLKRENEQLKKTDADMTKPQPCTKYRDAERMAWIAKLDEETHEVIQEAYTVSQLEQTNKKALCEAMNEVLQNARKRLAMELTDVKTLCESWLYAEGWDEEERGELQREVNEKNKKRGYFGID